MRGQSTSYVGLLAVATIALATTACGSDPKVEPKTGNDFAGMDTQPAPKPKPKPKAKPSKTSSPVSVGSALQKMCDLPEANFDFDSSSVGAGAHDMLNALATCFISGPAKGRRMNIIGHADSRGETEYNFALGQQRAGAVADYLKNRGVTADRMYSTSLGELEATGTDDKGYADDRRVEITLAVD